MTCLELIDCFAQILELVVLSVSCLETVSLGQSGVVSVALRAALASFPGFAVGDPEAGPCLFSHFFSFRAPRSGFSSRAGPGAGPAAQWPQVPFIYVSAGHRHITHAWHRFSASGKRDWQNGQHYHTTREQQLLDNFHHSSFNIPRRVLGTRQLGIPHPGSTLNAPPVGAPSSREFVARRASWLLRPHHTTVPHRLRCFARRRPCVGAFGSCPGPSRQYGSPLYAARLPG